jgi:iron(III) transport system ATP-binding protein
MTAIHCHDVMRAFNGVLALDGFELEVPAGSIVSLVGPSGSGKTTALRVIAGFEVPDRGSVDIGERTVVGPGVNVPPEKRRVGMVFQDYALFPNMTVAANVGYGVDPAQRAAAVAAALELVAMPALGDRMPAELSGGEQQRVALARALAAEPDVVLLDEPFSNLDAPHREKMRREVRLILKGAGATAVLVTHDQSEALAVADIVAVMRAGKVVQTGPPHVVYAAPADPWVASFLGDSVLITGTATMGQVETDLGVFPYRGRAHGAVDVMIRPEWIHPYPESDGPGIVVEREFYGHDQMVLIEIAHGRLVQSRIGPRPLLNRGDRVSLGIDEFVVFERHVIDPSLEETP